MRIEDDEGHALPWERHRLRAAEGARAGRGQGPISCGEEPILDAQGFFDTGDVATIDRFGNMQVVDRSKDVIKSGGEWISSIDL